MKKLLVILLLPAFANADPGTATKYLINEPASLFDIGLIRAHLHFDMADPLIKSSYEHSDPKLFYSAVFNYQYEDDLFVLKLSVLSSHSKKLRCEDLITRYGNILQNLMYRWFSHEEYSVASEPDDFEDLLLRRVELRCATTSREARRKLLDDKVYWTEY